MDKKNETSSRQNNQHETITCPKCGNLNDSSSKECLKCGVVFSKYYELLKRKKKENEIKANELLSKAKRMVIVNIAHDGIVVGGRNPYNGLKLLKEITEKYPNTSANTSAQELIDKAAQVKQKVQEAQSKKQKERKLIAYCLAIFVFIGAIHTFKWFVERKYRKASFTIEEIEEMSNRLDEAVRPLMSEERSENYATSNIPRNGYDWQRMSEADKVNYCQVLIYGAEGLGIYSSEKVYLGASYFSGRIGYYYGIYSNSDSINKATAWCYPEVKKLLDGL